jgi:hypothetical protein
MVPNISDILSNSAVTGYNRKRDNLKFWLSEDYDDDLKEVISLPNMNITKRLVLELKCDFTFPEGEAYDESDIPADHLFRILPRIEIETSNQDRILNTTFEFLWFKTSISRGGIAPLTAFPATSTDGSVYAFAEIDFSDYQDFGLDSDMLEQLRMSIQWGNQNTIFDQTNIVMSGATLKIWYDERIRYKDIVMHPIMRTTYFEKDLHDITDGRVELPKGERLQRMYIQLRADGVPIEITEAILPRLSIEFNGQVVWGNFNGFEAVNLWHMYYGYEHRHWGIPLFACDYVFPAVIQGFVGLICSFVINRSFIIIDFVDIYNHQLSHAVNSMASDNFNLIYSFNTSGLTHPTARVFLDSHLTVADRLRNANSRTSQIMSPEMRLAIINNAIATDNPTAIINDPTNFDIADLIKYARSNYSADKLKQFLAKHPNIKQMILNWQRENR